MKKLVLILLALVMVVSVFASCGDGKDPSSTPKQTTKKPAGDKTPGGDTTEIPEEEKINLDLDAIDHNSQLVSIYHWKPDAGLEEFDMVIDDSNKNDAVAVSISNRNTYTEIDLGVDLDWFEQKNSGYTQIRNFIDKLEARLTDTPVDIIAGQTRVMPYLMMEGYLTDLNTYSDSLDLEKAWWPESLSDVFDIKGNTYFISGDISANLLRMMTVIFVNKTKLESTGTNYDEFMQKIERYEWTLADLIELTNDQYQNLDNDPNPSAGDQFGLVTTYFHSDGLYAGLGYKYMISSSKDDQVFRLSSQIANETADNYVKDMKDWNATHNLFMDPNEKIYEDAFTNGQALFLLHRAWFGFELAKTEVNYAVIPTPRLDVAVDEDDQEYFTTIGNQFTSYGICKDATDYDIAAETIQVLGYHALTTTTPSLYEVSFIGKFAKDDYTIKMFEIIRESIIFDIGRVYDVFISTTEPGYTDYLLPNIISLPIRGNLDGTEISFNFTSSGDPTRKKMDDYIKEANKKLIDFINAQQ